MTQRIFVLSADPYYRQAMAYIDREWRAAARDGRPLRVRVTDQPTRTLEQNAAMWAALDDIAEQVEWHGQRLSAQEWKDMATAALKRQKVVPGIDGGFVALGFSTSRMTKSQLSELLDFLHAFGAQHSVKFSDQPTEQTA